MNNPRVSIAIAAYQAEKAITDLITSLLTQEERDFVIDEIIVHIDGNLDNTKTIVGQFTDGRIKILKTEPRQGFAQAIKTILKNAVGEIVITLNDDISIKDNQFISKIVAPFLVTDNLGMVCGNPQPNKPRTFVERAIVSTFRAYERVVVKINSGSNQYCVDGKIMGFNKHFIQSILETENFNTMGNVDTFMYFLCIEKEFKFLFEINAIAYFNNPSNLKDFIEWFARNNSQEYILKRRFNFDLLDRIKISSLNLMYSCLIEFFKNPFGSIFILLFRFYIKIKAWFYGKNFNNNWDSVSSSK